MQISSFKDLIVWQKSIEVVVLVYKISSQYPRTEQYGLIGQMQRAAVSIPANIAEGYKRRSVGDYRRFLCIADASAAELETLLIISDKIYKKVSTDNIVSLLTEIQKMLYSMIKKLSK